MVTGAKIRVLDVISKFWGENFYKKMKNTENIGGHIRPRRGQRKRTGMSATGTED